MGLSGREVKSNQTPERQCWLWRKVYKIRTKYSKTLEFPCFPPPTVLQLCFTLSGTSSLPVFDRKWALTCWCLIQCGASSGSQHALCSIAPAYRSTSIGCRCWAQNGNPAWPWYSTHVIPGKEWVANIGCRNGWVMTKWSVHCELAGAQVENVIPSKC